MKKLFTALLIFTFALGLSACEEEMCEGKGGIEIPCSDLESPTELDYLEAGTHIVGTDIEAGLYLFVVNSAPGTITRQDSSNMTIATVTLNTRTYIEVKSTDHAIAFNGGILWPINEAPELQDLTVWNEGGYLVGDEIATGDYTFKMEPGETMATILLLSSFDFEDGSTVQTYTTDDVTTGQSINIPSGTYAIYIEGGHLVQE